MRAPWRLSRRPVTPEGDDREPDAIRTAKLEAEAVARRDRAAARGPGGKEWARRARATATAVGQRLAPAGRGILALLGRIAPPISNGLMAVARASALGLLWLTEAGERAVGWLGEHAVPALERLLRGAAAWITPVSTFAVVGGAAAISLGVSQFLDYRGVAIGAPHYKGVVGVTAPAPLTDIKVAGTAHLYLLLPVAAAALVLIALTVLGRWRLGRWVAALGLAGIAVSLIIDAPKGLDAGNAGVAFAGADTELLKGFWIQLLSSVVLVLCGLLLAREVRSTAIAGDPEQAPRRPRPRAGGAGKGGRASSRPRRPRWGASA